MAAICSFQTNKKLVKCGDGAVRRRERVERERRWHGSERDRGGGGMLRQKTSFLGNFWDAFVDERTYHVVADVRPPPLGTTSKRGSSQDQAEDISKDISVCYWYTDIRSDM